MPTFDEAVGRLTSKLGIPRGEAIGHIRRLADQGTLTNSDIPDLEDSLGASSRGSMGMEFMSGAEETLKAPFKTLNKALGSPLYDPLGDTLAPGGTETLSHEAAPWSRMAGDVAGSIPGFEALGAGLEGVPLVGKLLSSTAPKMLGDKVLESYAGRNFFKEILRNAITAIPANELGLFGPGQSNKAAMIMGAAAPVATRAVAAPIRALVGSLEGPFMSMLKKAMGEGGGGALATDAGMNEADVGGGAAKQGIQDILGQAGEQPSTFSDLLKPKPAVEPAAAAAVVRSPSDEAQVAEAMFGVPPAEPSKPGFMQTADEKLKLKNREPIGTVLARTDEPFKADFLKKLPGRGNSSTFYDYRNPEAASIPTGKLALDKPLVLDLDTTGEEAYRDAVRRLFPDNEYIQMQIEDSTNPKDLATEIMGRYAKQNGYDGVVFKTPTSENNLVHDFSKFEPSAHNELSDKRFSEVPKKKVTPVAKYFDPVREATKPEVPGQVTPFEELRIQAQDEVASPPTHYIEGPKGEISQEPDAEPEAMRRDRTHAMRVFEGSEGFDEDMKNGYAAAQPMSRKAGAWFRLPSNVSDHPNWRSYISDVFNSYRQSVRESRSMGRALKRITKDMSPEEYDQMIYAVKGLERDPLKSELPLRQTRDVTGIDQKILDKAVAFRTQITDRMVTHVTGNDPRTFSILQSYNFPHTRSALEDFRSIQERGVLMNGAAPTDEEKVVAGRLLGMLHFNDTHDLDWEPMEGYFTHNPIANERAWLRTLLAGNEDMSKLGLNMTYRDSLTQAITDADKRLAELDLQFKQDEMRTLPSRDSVPRKQFFGPIHVASDPKAAAFRFETDIQKVGADYIMGGVAKRRNDYILALTKQLKQSTPMTGAMDDYLTTYANTVRGARGYRGDSLVADMVNAIVGKGEGGVGRFSAHDIHTATDKIMAWQYWTKLALTPLRFPIINLTHSLVTTFSDVGSEIYGRAVFKVLADPERAMMRGMADGVINVQSDWLKETSDRGMANVPGPVRKVFGGLSDFADHFRKLVDYEAALMQYAKGDISPAAVTFIKEKEGRTAIQAAREYARAHVDALQFRFGIENKPLMFSGSPVQRLASQFRTWPVGLAAYIGRVGKDAVATGDYSRAIRLGAALTFFGGLPVFVGGPNIFRAVRREALKHGINLPDDPGFALAAHAFGYHGDIANANIVSLQDPFGMPHSLTSLAGPAIGSTIDLGMHEWQKWMDTGRLSLGPVISWLSPQAKAVIEGGGELAHGGVFGPNGALEIQRPWLAAVIRGLDLAPSARSVRYNFEQDIAAAIQHGDPQLITSLVQDARSKGIIIDSHFEASIKSVLARHKKTSALTLFQDMQQ